MGKSDVMPLSGLILKPFYSAVTWRSWTEDGGTTNGSSQDRSLLLNPELITNSIICFMSVHAYLSYSFSNRINIVWIKQTLGELVYFSCLL